MLCVHSASALAATAWVSSSLLCLAPIAPEAGNRLALQLLVYHLDVPGAQVFDLRLILEDVLFLLDELLIRQG